MSIGLWMESGSTLADYATTPDAPGLAHATDLSLRVAFHGDPTISRQMMLATKWGNAARSVKAWTIYLSTNGTIATLRWTDTGAIDRSRVLTLPFTDRNGAIRADLAIAGGLASVSWYRSHDFHEWDHIGDSVAITSANLDPGSDGPLDIGGFHAGIGFNWTDWILRCQIVAGGDLTFDARLADPRTWSPDRRSLIDPISGAEISVMGDAALHGNRVPNLGVAA